MLILPTFELFNKLRCRLPEFKDPHHFRHLVMLHPTAHPAHHQVRLRHKGTKSLVLLGKAILQWHHHRSIFAEPKKGGNKKTGDSALGGSIFCLFVSFSFLCRFVWAVNI